MRLLSLTTAGEAAVPGSADGASGTGLGDAARGAVGAHVVRRRVRSRSSTPDGPPARTPHAWTSSWRAAARERAALRRAAARSPPWRCSWLSSLAPQAFAPAVRPAHPVRRTADLRSGQSPRPGARAPAAPCALAAAASTVVAVGLGILVTRPSGARVPAAVAHAREHRPDLSAGGGAGGGGAAGRLRREADADRAVRLRAAADLREHHRRACRTCRRRCWKRPAGMGMSARQRLRAVELPLALPADPGGHPAVAGHQRRHRDHRLDGGRQGPGRGHHCRAAVQQYRLRPAGRTGDRAHGGAALRRAGGARAALVPYRAHRLRRTSRKAPP